jgi:multimeric flavodoxin WrbA
MTSESVPKARPEKPVKVLAFNGSPKTDKGNTALLLGPFLDGMKAAGAGVELFYTSQLDINPCHGEFNCWLKTPGKCYQEDDMQMFHPKLRDADIFVFASPLYVWGVTGTLKNLMDRLIPLMQPSIELRDGHCSHPLRPGTKEVKIALVSNCGFWEIDNFDPLLKQFEMLCKVEGFHFAGALLRPHGPALAPMMHMGAPVGDVFEAAKEAGRQLVENGEIAEETLKVVSRELLPRDVYLQIANQQFQRVLDLLEQNSVSV